jgi:hypothetical protein
MAPGLRTAMTNDAREDESLMNGAAHLPDPAVQEHLLDLYFTFVHPSFPVVHKRAFFQAIKNG